MDDIDVSIDGVTVEVPVTYLGVGPNQPRVKV